MMHDGVKYEKQRVWEYRQIHQKLKEGNLPGRRL